MELRQLEYFVAVAEEGTFTKGAHRVHVAQSAVSATIRKLERELGVPLFTRDAQATTLTDAGRAFLPEARAVLGTAVQAVDAVGAVRGGLRGNVRIGCGASGGISDGVEGVLHIDLAALLGRYHETHPRVTIRMRGAMNGTGQLEEVASGGLDLAIVGAIEQPTGVRLRQIGSQRWFFVCSRHHRLAGAASVTLEELAHESFVDFPPGWGGRALVDRAFARAGIVRDIAFEVVDQIGAVGLVRNNLGVAFLPRAGSENADTAVIDVAGVDLDLPIVLATPTDRPAPPAAGALVDAILDAAGRPG